VHKFWSNLAVQLGKRAGLVSVIGLLVTIGLGFGITNLKFATGQDSYLNRDEVIYKDNVQYQDLFGGNAMLSVIQMDPGHKVEELFDPAGRRAMTEMGDQLVRDGRALGVISPLTALQFSHNLVTQSVSADGTVGEAAAITDSVAGKALLAALNTATKGGDADAIAARGADTGATLGRIAKVTGPHTLDNPEWVKFLLYDNQGNIRKALTPFFPNDHTAEVVARLHGNESIEQEGKDAKAIVAASHRYLRFEHAHVTTTGASVLLSDLNDYLRGGMLTLGGIAVAIMIVILLVLFGVRWRLLPLAVVLIGVVWAFGLAGYLGIPLTIVTISGLPVMLGIGIDYAIQMHARVEEEVIIDRDRHPIQATARNLCPALLVVTFDAIFAFLALQFAKVPMIRQFGLLLALGIAVICIGSIIIPLATLGIREFKSPTKGRDFREGPLGRLVVGLGGMPKAAAVPLAVIAIGIFVWGILVEGDLVIQTDPVKWVNQSSQVITDLHTVERTLGGSNEMGVFIKGRTNLLADQESIDYVDAFERHFADSPRIAIGTSLNTTVRDLMYVPGAADVTPTAADLQAAYAVAPKDIQVSVAAKGGTALNIVYLTGKGSLANQSVLVDQMRHRVRVTPPPGHEIVTPSGLAVVGVGLLDNLEANRILLTYLSIAFVGLFLAVRLRSLIRSLLSLVPVLIAVGLASILAWAFGWQLSPMTAVGGPLVVAACTEFTSLILLRFVEERGRGESPKEAVDVTAARTGRAFIVSGLTAISGVAVLSFSSLPLLRDFGRIVAMNVAVALLSALVVLPPMLVWADDDKRRWVSKGMLRHRHEAEYVDTPYEPGESATATT
jgi:hydrophobe/amphiphile efflux-3 (HAE3) family protein